MKRRAPHRGGSQMRAFIIKEWKQIFRDPLTLLILVAMPITEMLLFGFAMNMDVTDIRTVIIDHSADETGEQLAEALEGHATFLYRGMLADRRVAEEMMKAGALDLAHLVPATGSPSLHTRQPTTKPVMAVV